MEKMDVDEAVVDLSIRYVQSINLLFYLKLLCVTWGVLSGNKIVDFAVFATYMFISLQYLLIISNCDVNSFLLQTLPTAAELKNSRYEHE